MAHIQFRSRRQTVTNGSIARAVSDEDGIICTWEATIDDDDKNQFKWTFDWSQLQRDGAESISGTIQVHLSDTYRFHGTSDIPVEMYDTDTVEFTVPHRTNQKRYANFDYDFDVKYRSEKNLSIDEMFGASDQNDVVLIVEEKRLHVNKTFLSLHSEFFRGLFSKNFMEGSMEEVKVEEVTVEDFALLMGTILPKTVFPTDKTAEKILHLARRFLMSSVTGHVEHHLLYNSKHENETLLWMADEFGMPTLLDKCIRKINSVEKAKKLKRSPKYGNISVDTRAKLFDRLLQFV